MPNPGIVETMQTRKKQKSKWLQELAPEDAALLDFGIEADYGDRILNNFGTHIQSDITRVADFLYLKYGIKWDRLYAAYTAEYNPIWNVDGSITETETRDLATDHTGTDTTGSSGTDTLKHTGTETLADSGTDTATHIGTETLADSGTDTATHIGTETLADSGTDTEKHTGTESITDSGTDSESRSGTDRRETTGNVYGFDSSGAVPSDSGSETVTAGIGTSTTYGKKEDNTKDLTDITTYGKTEENTKNLTDSTKYGKTEENTKNLTDSTTYGRTDTTTHNTKDTDKGTITRLTTRGGNIGVTMTQQMLEADSEYWNKITSLFYHQVITDIVDEITYKINPVEMY